MMLKVATTFASTRPSRAGSSHRAELDPALAGRAFAIDEIACSSAARVLSMLRNEPASTTAWAPLSYELLFRVSLAAICHQINWDFLSLRIRQSFDRLNMDAKGLAKVSAADVLSWLDGYHRKDRIRAKERAAMLRDVGQTIIDKFGGDAGNLLAQCGARLSGDAGFMALLDRFAAFKADPLRKKSNVLVHEIVRDGIVRFSDENTIKPAVDYHIMRMYLRTGRVVPMHRSVKDLLKKDSAPRPRLVRLLREAVSEALSLTSLYAKMSIPEVNSLEWQIGRDICDRQSPRCTNATGALSASSGSNDNRCPHSTFCRAFMDPEFRQLREPDLKKSFY